MNKGIAPLLCGILFLVLHASSCSGQGIDIRKPVDQLNAMLNPLPSGSPLLYEDGIFAPLDPTFMNCSVIGLGEAAHGAKEFFELKHRLFRYLVENHGFRALAYEMNFGLALDIDRYVTHSVGNIDSLLSTFYWIQANEEVLNLLCWMREYNRDRPEADKVHFIGIDSQLDIWDIGRFERLIREFYPIASEELTAPIEDVRAYGKIDYKELSPDEYGRIGKALDSIKAAIQATCRQGDRHGFLIAARLADGLIRSHEFLYDVYQGLDNPRDKHLASQALWIGEYLGEGTPLALWAHNAHVGRDPSYDKYGNGSMGRFLADSLGSDYVVIATSFAWGSFTAVMADSLGNDTPPLTCTVDEVPADESVHGLLDQAEEERYFLLLRGIKEHSALYRYLNRDLPMLGVGDFYLGDPEAHAANRVKNCIEFFDVIFFLNNTRPLSLLPSYTR